MKVSVIYIFPIAGLDPVNHHELAINFSKSYREFPADYEHELVVVSNGGPPSDGGKAVFDGLNVRWFDHDDSGQDIGAFIAFAKQADCEVQVGIGGGTYFKRRGWLKRMMEAWEKHGPGFYGSLATNELAPHIQTTGFWCSPELIRRYPNRVVTFDERREFEHGITALHIQAKNEGLPVKLVTWDGEYDQPEWRTPPNIFRRGDQSNCLCFFKFSRMYETASPQQQAIYASLADRNSA